MKFSTSLNRLNQPASELFKAFDGVFNFWGLLILCDLLNERVAEGVTSDPHDFSHD